MDFKMSIKTDISINGYIYIINVLLIFWTKTSNLLVQIWITSFDWPSYSKSLLQRWMKLYLNLKLRLNGNLTWS